MKPRSLFLFPIIVGAFVNFAGTVVVGGGLGFFLALGAGTDSGMVATDLATYTLPLALFVSFVAMAFSVIGGYAAAQTASTRRILHAVLSGVLVSLVGLVMLLVTPDGQTSINLVLNVLGVPAVILGAFLGGRWATLGNPEETTWLDSVAPRVGVSTTVLYVVATLLVVAYTVAVGVWYKHTPACTVETVYIQGTMYTTSQGSGSDPASSGELETYSAGTAKIFEELEKRRDVKAILIEVDSGGGSPVAGEELANAIKASSKPTVALVRSIGASAAYWAASGADTIIASSNSDVGGIGVQVNYLDSYKRNLEEGLNPNVITSAKFKTLGDPNLPLSSEARAIIQRDVDEVHRNFVAAVAENRGLSIEEVEGLADGATVLGSMALREGLIDQVGGFAETKQLLAEILGEEPRICESYYPAETESTY
ncbi:MAG: S49 family peptidase [Candidatus Pacebacteria bacterium]|nr:S49 family peptidase [Candidatus Paceibacterota bacterium]